MADDRKSNTDFLEAFDEFVNNVHVDLRVGVRDALLKKTYDEICSKIKYTTGNREPDCVHGEDPTQSEGVQPESENPEDEAPASKRPRRRMAPITGRSQARQRAAPSPNAASMALLSKKEREKQLQEAARRKEASARVDACGSGSIVASLNVSNAWTKVLKRRYGKDIAGDSPYTANMSTAEINKTAAAQLQVESEHQHRFGRNVAVDSLPTS